MKPAARKTKIVATIGPASQDEQTLRALIREGINVCRLNFSHDDQRGHKVKVDLIKRIREEEGKHVAIMMDTRGPEVRTGTFEGGKATFETGSTVWIYHNDMIGNEEGFSVTYKNLDRDLKAGAIVLLDDGRIEMIVERIEGRDICLKVTNGGEISNRKSLNFPGVALRLPSLSQSDISDIRFAAKEGFDFIAVSFVRSASDIFAIRELLKESGAPDIQLIAKIENRQGIRNFEGILDAADGIMVARGDLGVEIPSYEVPTMQKRMIRSCYLRGKASITATEMLDSMQRNPRPTRAEVSDVANAILDGTSAVMLSGETASGRYPVEAVKMMREIALYTESSIDYWDIFQRTTFDLLPSITNAVSHACCMTAHDLSAAAIIAVTHSGRTARLIARFRPQAPIIAPTIGDRQSRQLALTWGVEPCVIPEVDTTDELFTRSIEAARATGLVDEGDLVVISAGTPVGRSGTTNTLRVAAVLSEEEVIITPSQLS
ncbi:MAG: pyruvate kinase [Bacillota bacterium]|nr:pyruvate kinase [Bacillota bacterium]